LSADVHASQIPNPAPPNALPGYPTPRHFFEEGQRKKMRRRRGLCPPHPPGFTAFGHRQSAARARVRTKRAARVRALERAVWRSAALRSIPSVALSSAVVFEACLMPVAECDKSRGVRGAEPPASAHFLLRFFATCRLPREWAFVQSMMNVLAHQIALSGEGTGDARINRR
jgi:hypothetical protein